MSRTDGCVRICNHETHMRISFVASKACNSHAVNNNRSLRARRGTIFSRSGVRLDGRSHRDEPLAGDRVTQHLLAKSGSSASSAGSFYLVSILFVIGNRG
ncbi:hypothetical protein NDU88_006975 [Pleurodeles waltl]|uniref:Uncharacterized protein n=1 Tax=Pleurodeles waltl TaxID=8319 RepID=A0AAV7N420_PLEWA|nr:hypothetical protein NDU88_006975 [Pleurodeles waltl]